MARRNRRLDAVAILGLGRFGTSLALELMKEEIEVLAVDSDQRIVESLAGQLTQVVSADTTSEEALRQLSVHEFYRVVIAVGNNLEASILTATVCLGFETPEIWAKAISEPHAKILSQLGVHHIVRPEHDMGKRVAHLVAGRMLDYMEFDDGYALVKTTPPAAIVGQPLSKTEVRKRYRRHHRRHQTARRRLHLRHPRDRGQPRRRHHRLRQDHTSWNTSATKSEAYVPVRAVQPFGRLRRTASVSGSPSCASRPGAARAECVRVRWRSHEGSVRASRRSQPRPADTPVRHQTGRVNPAAN